MNPFVEFLAWGLPQAAIALVLAGALGITMLVILHKRCPRVRLARQDEAFMWALVYGVAGVFAGLLLPAVIDGSIRCPECGYHPSAPRPLED